VRSQQTQQIVVVNVTTYKPCFERHLPGKRATPVDNVSNAVCHAEVNELRDNVADWALGDLPDVCLSRPGIQSELYLIE